MIDLDELIKVSGKDWTEGASGWFCWKPGDYRTVLMGYQRSRERFVICGFYRHPFSVWETKEYYAETLEDAIAQAKAVAELLR